MKQYYISVKYRDYWSNKNEYKYKFLSGMPNERLMLVCSKSKAEKYDEEDKDYFLNVFESNRTDVRLEEVK